MGKFILVTETFGYDNSCTTLWEMDAAETPCDFASMCENPEGTFNTYAEAIAYCEANHIRFKDETTATLTDAECDKIYAHLAHLPV